MPRVLRAGPGGRIEHISSMPGLRNSVTVNGSPGLAPISPAMRAMRAGSILASAQLTPAPLRRAHAWGPRRVEKGPGVAGVLMGGGAARPRHDHVARLRGHGGDGALELGQR